VLLNKVIFTEISSRIQVNLDLRFTFSWAYFRCRIEQNVRVIWFEF